MLTIGDFARLGGVSVRMLRHYDAIGLLTPVRVDDASGYRYYATHQFMRLNRLLVLKDLGFTLEQVRTILDEQIAPQELRGMLRLRHAELVEQIHADRQRLAQVEARLRAIESEEDMNTLPEHTVEIVPVTGHRLIALHATADDTTTIGTVIGPLFGRLTGALQSDGHALTGDEHTVAQYDVAESGEVSVLAGFPWPHPTATPALTAVGAHVVDLPPVQQCARTVHRGSIAGISQTWARFITAVDSEGWQLAGPAREVYLHTPMDAPDAWVLELHQPVRRP